MAKIMLVEDDNNLREIYEARLAADGYEIIAAQDGEEALAMAVKEKPDLIISDIMMPKISGFDMLDILRSTPETKNTKVIMMTALSQAEDKARAAQMGADRYLVKSQVTLEDVAKVAREILAGGDTQSTEAPQASAEQPSASTASATPLNEPTPTIGVQVAPQMPATPAVPTPVTNTVTPPPEPVHTPPPQLPSDQPAATQSPTTSPITQTTTLPVADATQPSAATPSDTPASAPEHIEPKDTLDPSLAETSKSESADVEAQISDFVEHAKPEPGAPVAPQSAPSIGINADGIITQGVEESQPEPAPFKMPDASPPSQPTPPTEQTTPEPPVNTNSAPIPQPTPTPQTPPTPPPASASPQTFTPTAAPSATPPPANPSQPTTATTVQQPTSSPPAHPETKPPEVKTAVQPVHQKVIQPINDLSKSSVDLNALLAQEQAKAAGAGQVPPVQAFVSPEIQAENEAAAAAAAANQPNAAPVPGTTFDPNSVAL